MTNREPWRVSTKNGLDSGGFGQGVKFSTSDKMISQDLRMGFKVDKAERPTLRHRHTLLQFFKPVQDDVDFGEGSHLVCPKSGIWLGDLAFEGGPSLVCELKHPSVIVNGDEFVRNKTFHELRERLMPSLIKDEAMCVEIPHGDRVTLLSDEFQQALSGRLNVCAHCVRSLFDPLPR